MLGNSFSMGGNNFQFGDDVVLYGMINGHDRANLT